MTECLPLSFPEADRRNGNRGMATRVVFIRRIMGNLFPETKNNSTLQRFHEKRVLLFQHLEV